MRSAVVAARRQVIVPPIAAVSSHSTGAGAIISSAVALTAPTVHDDERGEGGVAPAACAWRRATVRPTIQPSPAHGSSIADVRETYGSTYGESW